MELFKLIFNIVLSLAILIILYILIYFYHEYKSNALDETIRTVMREEFYLQELKWNVYYNDPTYAIR
jgi:hypothetical protein